MKGIVFVLLGELVEQQFGLDVWDNLLDNTELESGGAFTAAATYPDEELFALVDALSEKTNIAAPELITVFGEFMFPKLAEKYPIFTEGHSNLKSFLKSVDDVIHVEVKKLYPEAGLPGMRYEEPSERELTIYYQSPRKLCHLGVGLIQGAAKHFNTEVKLEHPVCMHQEADHCRLELMFSE